MFYALPRYIAIELNDCSRPILIEIYDHDIIGESQQNILQTGYGVLVQKVELFMLSNSLWPAKSHVWIMPFEEFQDQFEFVPAPQLNQIGSQSYYGVSPR